MRKYIFKEIILKEEKGLRLDQPQGLPWTLFATCPAMKPPMIPSNPFVAPLLPKNRLFVSPEFPEFMFPPPPRHGLKIWLPRKEATAPMAAPAIAESRLLLPVKNRVLPASLLLLPLRGAALDMRARPVVRRREGSILLFRQMMSVSTRVRRQTARVGLNSLPKSDRTEGASDQGSLQPCTPH